MLARLEYSPAWLWSHLLDPRKGRWLGFSSQVALVTLQACQGFVVFSILQKESKVYLFSCLSHGEIKPILQTKFLLEMLLLIFNQYSLSTWTGHRIISEWQHRPLWFNYYFFYLTAKETHRQVPVMCSCSVGQMYCPQASLFFHCSFELISNFSPSLSSPLSF